MTEDVVSPAAKATLALRRRFPRFEFRNSCFGFVSDFEIRISDLSRPAGPMM